MAFEMDPAACAEVFRAAGYEDLTVCDVITAWKEGNRTWEVVVDRGGRLKATITYASAPPQECFVPVRERQAKVLVESQTIVTVMFVLQSNDELFDALQAVEIAARTCPPAPHSLDGGFAERDRPDDAQANES